MNSASSILHRNPHPTSWSPLQTEVDALVGGFVSQATDWRSLSAFVAAGSAYRIGRLGISSLGAGFRTVSVGAGLAAEVSTFEFTHRALISNSQSEIPNLWRWSGSGGIRQGLFQSFITFSALKGAGHLGRSENVVLQHLLQDSAMVTGHQVSGLLGVTPAPTGSLAEQFLHAEATVLQLGAGLSLVHGLAPGLHGIQQGLDLSFRGSEIPPASSLPRRAGENFAFSSAVAGRGPASFEDPNLLSPIFSMSGAGKENPSRPEGLAGAVSTGSGEIHRVDHPALALFLLVAQQEGKTPEQAEAIVPRGEWEALTRLPGSSLVPRSEAAQDVFIRQALSGPLDLRQKFESLKSTLGNPHYMGRVFAGASGNTAYALFSNLDYVRDVFGETLESLMRPRSDLEADLAEARGDILKSLTILGELYRILGQTENGAFLRGAFIGKAAFGFRGIRFHYQQFERDALQAASPELRRQLNLESVPSYRDLILRTFRFTRRPSDEP